MAVGYKQIEGGYMVVKDGKDYIRTTNQQAEAEIVESLMWETEEEVDIKVLLYSGGMDSWLIKELWKPDLSLYVATGSKYSAEEEGRVDVPVVDFLDLSDYERADYIIPYRNVYLCLAALNEVERRWPLEKWKSRSRVVQICLGATAGDRVLDKSEEFAERLGGLLTYLSSPQHWTGGNKQRVEIVLPYKHYTKRQLLRKYKGDMLSAWLGSFSCYSPDSSGRPCGKCKACARKTVAFTLEGFVDREYVELAREYFEESGILKQIADGVYGRAEEEKEILEFMKITETLN